jgi:exopolysaccharide biosynthesis polyprenyl glycosylphosphotransferase
MSQDRLQMLASRRARERSLPSAGNGGYNGATANGHGPAREAVRTPGGNEIGIPEGRVDGPILRRDQVYRRMLACADVASAVLALVIGVTLLGDYDALAPTALVGVPLVMAVSKVLGLYDRDAHLLKKTTLEEAPALFQVATFYALVIWLAEGVFVNGDLGRQQILGLWGLLFVFMLAARALARVVARQASSPERCLLVGDEATAERLREKLECTPAAHAVAVGRVSLGSSRRSNGGLPDTRRLPLLGDTDTLGLILAEYDIDRAIIAPGATDSETILDAVRMVRSLGVKVSVLPRLFEVVGSSVEFDEIEGLMLLGLRRDGLSRSSWLMKRAMDLAGASIGLMVLAPLLAATALAIRLNSPGPVLFRQTRIGREGSRFEMVKFRTMVVGADERKAELTGLNEAEGLFKIAEDPRMTRVGRFLRRSSLDELPQLINVLRGDMSLVGPRPLVPDEDLRVEGWDRRRLHVMPGMTGVWQVGTSHIPLNEMVKMDYLYGANWSLWLDLKILLRTIPHALARRGL